jgi:hypothetical protein
MEKKHEPKVAELCEKIKEEINELDWISDRNIPHTVSIYSYVLELVDYAMDQATALDHKANH